MSGPPSDWTPLHRAVWKHDYDQVKSLVENRNGDINRTDDQGWTPLHLACATDEAWLFRSHQVWDRGYSMSGRSSKDYSRWEWAGTHYYSPDEERTTSLRILEILLQNGANVHVRAKGFCTALHCAADGGWLSHALALVKAGAKAHDGVECSPLHWAKDGSGSNHPVAMFLREELGEVGLTNFERDHEREAAAMEEDRNRVRDGPRSLGFKEGIPQPSQALPNPLPKKFLPRSERPLFKKQTHTRVDSSGLCSVCCEISLKSLIYLPGYIHLSSFELVQQSATRCKLCQVIASVLPEGHKLRRGEYSQILISASNGSLYRSTCRSDLLRVMEFQLSHGCICNKLNPEPSPDFTKCKGRCNILQTASVTMFTSQEMSDCVKKIQPGKLLEANPISALTTITMKGWLEACDSDHRAECGTSSTSKGETLLPTRLVDVGTDGESKIRLVDANGSFGNYVALSHRWVTGPMPPWVTKEDTLGKRHSWFPTNDLPTSILDAVKVTRLIGFRYVWIDSLCIVQDSAEDWNAEASKMATVYANAYVTIFADRGKDDDHGFLDLRQVFPVIPIVIKAENDFPLTIQLRKSAPDSYQSIERSLFRSDCDTSSYLSKRAWILQERVLSRRIIHFGEHQMYWECGNTAVAEDGHIVRYSDRQWLVAIKKMLNAKNSTEIESFNNWTKLVEVYSSLDLTQGEDKLPALSGLAKTFWQKRNDTYIAGLWKRSLNAGLAWSTQIHDPDDLPPRPTQYRAPSFSWAWTDYEIRTEKIEDLHLDEKANEFDLNFLSSDINLLGTDPFGKIRHCTITVSGLLQPAINLGPFLTILGMSAKGFNPLYDLEMMPIGNLRNDAKDDIGIRDVFCLRLFGLSDDDHFLVLVLTASCDDECNTFRRIGSGSTARGLRSAYGDGKFFDGAERRTIVLV